VIVAGLIAPPSTAAQETRAEEVEKKQAEKAANLKPYEPNKFEAIMNKLEESFASPPSGFFPAFGSVYPGGGFTLGAGYRQFYARQAVFGPAGSTRRRLATTASGWTPFRMTARTTA
jgi:hypothetical protein